MTYQPTNKFRWLQRNASDLRGECAIFYTSGMRLVLQQWWTNTYGKGEWRDVPIETET